MKQLLNVALFTAATLLISPAFAHGGGAPKHGGVVATASDLAFELVAKDGNAVIHVEDHGKPLQTTGMRGKLTILTGAEKSEADLTAAGDNRLEAKGVKLASGAKVVAALTTASGKPVTVRFAIK